MRRHSYTLAFLILAQVIFCQILGETLIITHSYNRPDFIKTQYLSFKKFLKDPYKFVVFNDSRDDLLSKQIESICQELAIECFRIPPETHDKNNKAYSVGVDESIHYSLETVGYDHDGIVMIIDSDMFLVRDFNVTEYMEDYDLAAVPQRRHHLNYIWNGLMFMNMNTLPDKKSLNFSSGWVDNIVTDTGGHTYYYLRSHPTLRLNNIKQYFFYQSKLLCDVCFQAGVAGENKPFCVHNKPSAYTKDNLIKEGFDNKAIAFLLKPSEFYFDYFLAGGYFFHYRAGGNWNNLSREYHARKTAFIEEYLNNVVSDDVNANTRPKTEL